MRLRKLLGDGEAQAATTVGAVARSGDTVKAIKDVIQLIGRDTCSRVGHIKAHRVRLCPRAHRHAPPIRRVAQGIAQQVGQDLLQALLIARHNEAPVIDLYHQFDALGEGLRAKCLGGALHQATQIEIDYL